MNREYGIDLIKILSMLMVIILHICGTNGLIGKNTDYITYLIYIMAYVAVNLFGLVSGYLLIDKKKNRKKILLLWENVFFYSFFITILFIIIYSDNNYIAILKSFLPITTKQYWYFSSYLGLYIFMPYINNFLLNLSKRDFKLLCFLIICIFSFWNTITINDPFTLREGCSILWLFSLYVIGAYIKLYLNDFNKCKINSVIYLIVLFISFFLIQIYYSIDEIVNLHSLVLSYTSPFILLASLMIFFNIKNIKIKSSKLRKIVTLLSNTTFSIYLIHFHPMVVKYILSNVSNFFLFNKIYVNILFFSIVIFLICFVIDNMKEFLFKYLHIIHFNECVFFFIKSKYFLIYNYRKKIGREE